MKKTLIIIFIFLALGVTACENNTKKSVNNETTSAVNNLNTTNQTAENNKAASTAAADNSSTSKQSTLGGEQKSNTNNQVSSNTENNNLNQQSKKQEYKAKLDKIQLGFKGFDSTKATTNDMYQQVCKEYTQWDAALNEIYGVLKTQLSASDMKQLQSDELQWIKDRDAKAKSDASEMAGGTMEKVLYQGSMAKSTKERCYLLVDKYMK